MVPLPFRPLKAPQAIVSQISCCRFSATPFVGAPIYYENMDQHDTVDCIELSQVRRVYLKLASDWLCSNLELSVPRAVM
jgi:hypothetical protein